MLKSVPKSIRRKAVSRVINMTPMLSPDELQDEQEIRDPKICAAIGKSHQEFLAGTAILRS